VANRESKEKIDASSAQGTALSNELDELIEAARDYKPTAEEWEAFRRSFAYGNVSLDCPVVTREMIDQEADRLKLDEMDKK
jgi:hypothetical protein